jgi:hypothetical protein
MHGRDCINYQCGPAGEYMDIAYNTVLYTNGPAIKLRGTPSIAMDVISNVFAHKNQPDAIVENEVGLGAYGNTFGFNQAAATRLSCDFDADGKNDAFMATGVTWWYQSSRTGRWLYLRQSSASLSQTTLGDVNGDGRCDVSAGGQAFLTPDANAPTPRPDTRTVPNVIGMPWPQASATLTAAGFTPVVISLVDPGCTLTVDVVFSQVPRPDDAALRDGKVTIQAALPCQS